jgi:hypothetical protein
MNPRSFRPPRSLLAAAAIGLLGLLAPSSARADLIEPITYKGNGAGLQLDVTFNGNNLGTGNVGQYVMSLNGGPNFNTFCVDLYHTMPFTGTPGQTNGTYTYNVSVGNTIPSNFQGAPLGNYMAFLVNTYVNNPAAASLYLSTHGLTPPNTSTAEAAVQLAVWKLEYDLGNVNGTNVQWSGGPSSDQVNAFIQQAESLGGSSVTSAFIEQDNNGQSMASGTGTPPAVPEPASFVLLGMGLCGFGAYRWRTCSRLTVA